MPATIGQALDQEATAFVEELGLLLSETGFPPSVGKVLGFLLICEPDEQSAESLQANLQLSTGSVSTALSLLQTMDLVQRRSAPGQRRFYYRIDPECWKKIIAKRSRQMQQGVMLADKGLQLRPSDPRLVAMRAFYSKLVGLYHKL